MNSGPHILHIIDNLELGGTQMGLLTLARHWPRDKSRLTFCALGVGPLREIIEAAGVRVHVLRRPSLTSAGWPQIVYQLWQLRQNRVRLVELHGVDLIQTHLLSWVDFVVLSQRWTRRVKAVLWSAQGMDFLPQRPGRPASWFGKATMPGDRCNSICSCIGVY